METKKFISTLKGLRTKFTNKPNAEAEKKQVENLAEKFGGKLEVIATLKENGQDDLKDYFKKVMGLETIKPAEKPIGKILSKDEDGNEFAFVNGTTYKVDSIKKTLKKVYKDFQSLDNIDVDSVATAMPMTVYQRYLKDHFEGEDAPIKKGKLHFRGYRISCDVENGFLVEDCSKHYAVVDTPFEGIPTPKELGDWFKKPVIEHTPEELAAAVKRGEEIARERKQNKKTVEEVEEVAPDYEKLRKQVLRTIKDIRSKTIDFDPTKFPEMIPFKRWTKQVKTLITQWKNRKIRYAKFLNELERITTEETFEVKEKNHRSSFKGTLLPEFNKVGLLVGDKIEVDGKWIDAVPFLLEYLLAYEHRAMAQIMKYANGEITDVELIKNPLVQDWKVEYNKKALENTAHNARVLSMVFESVGVDAPQDLLYEADLEVGDKIMIFLDGDFRVKKVTEIDKGIMLSGKVGLFKLDKWIKLPKKEEK